MGLAQSLLSQYIMGAMGGKKDKKDKEPKDKHEIDPEPNPVHGFTHEDYIVKTDENGNQYSPNPDSPEGQIGQTDVGVPNLNPTETINGEPVDKSDYETSSISSAPGTTARTIYDKNNNIVTDPALVSEYQQALDEGYVNKPYRPFSGWQATRDPATAAWVGRQNAEFAIRDLVAQQQNSIKNGINAQNFEAVRRANDYGKLTPEQGALLTGGDVSAQNLDSVRQAISEGYLNNPEQTALKKHQQSEMEMRDLLAKAQNNIPEKGAAALGSGYDTQVATNTNLLRQLPKQNELFNSNADEQMLKNRVNAIGLNQQLDNTDYIKQIAQNNIYRELFSSHYGGITPEEALKNPYLPVVGQGSLTDTKNPLYHSPYQLAMETVNSMQNGTTPPHVQAANSLFGAPSRSLSYGLQNGAQPAAPLIPPPAAVVRPTAMSSSPEGINRFFGTSQTMQPVNQEQQMLSAFQQLNQPKPSVNSYSDLALKQLQMDAIRRKQLEEYTKANNMGYDTSLFKFYAH